MYQTLKKNKDPEVINILLNKIEKCNMQVNNASVILFSVAKKYSYIYFFKFKFKVLIGSFLQQSLRHYNVTMNGIFKIGNNNDLADKYFYF